MVIYHEDKKSIMKYKYTDVEVTVKISVHYHSYLTTYKN